MHAFFYPRGIRNNNPGNIRLSKTRWQGQKVLQADAEFVEFETPTAGLRALMKLLMTYHIKYGLDTVESIINRYAPPHENDSEAYKARVARRLGVRRGQEIDLRRTGVLETLARAIVRHENGAPPADMPKDWYADEDYKAAHKSL